MKQLMITALAVSMLTVFAYADDAASQSMMGDMPGKCGMAKMQRGNMYKHGRYYDCAGEMMEDGMMGPGMGMYGGGMGMMMDDPELSKMMMEEMKEHRKQMMKERMAFQQSMHKKMMRQPAVIKRMLGDILENPDAVKKVLDKNPGLKAKLKKVL